MPAATTHDLFCIDVQQRVASLSNISCPLFHLGAQGPDLFFFTGFHFLPGSLAKYGTLLHHQKPREVILWMREHATDDDLRAYVAGYLCHYAMDRTIHPLIEAYAYILSQSRHEPKGICHVWLESTLDVYMLGDINRYDVYKKILITPSEAEKLASFYQHLFLEVFNLHLPLSSLRRAPFEMARNLHLLAPNERKYKAIYRLENALHKPHFLSSLMLNNKKNCPLLNLYHTPYSDPQKGTAAASYPQLYEKSLRLALSLLENFRPESIDADFMGVPVPY